MSQHDNTEPKRTRESFNTVPDQYNQYRRGYPPDIIAHIIALAHMLPGSHVLEIGCGTGQLTLPLLEHDVTVLAVELGESLAAVARRKLSTFQNFHIEVYPFENWVLPSWHFDAVVCATSFHWLDPKVRAAKCAQALRPGGFLVAIYPHHIQDKNADFVQSTHTYYLKWGLSTDPNWHPPDATEISAMYRDIDECPDFASVERYRIRNTLEFTRSEYVGLLRTDSLVLALTDTAREGFLADMTALIDTHYAGVVFRDYLYEIVVGRKAD